MLKVWRTSPQEDEGCRRRYRQTTAEGRCHKPKQDAVLPKEQSRHQGAKKSSR